jgi:hypothetical protein
MMQTMLMKVLCLAAGLVFLLPPVAAAKIQGLCSDCHTDSYTEAFDGSLWREDCVGCHAIGTDQRIVVSPEGDLIPQVYHTDSRGDLAAGNFAYISGAKPGEGPSGSRKGHDVIDLFPGGDDQLTHPPGFIHNDKPAYFRHRLTCAGANGCHGLRNQLMIGPLGEPIPRVGMSAIKGAHHGNEDGFLIVADKVANSYRFLMGLQGLEHSYIPDLWQNVTAVIHNEYLGVQRLAGEDRHCSACHVGSTHPTADSYITSPRRSMSGFCETCHSDFHTQQGANQAFLRHPSDFVIPNRGEYAEYLFYELTAPVARQILPVEPTEVVTPGRDMVMCLSCHMAHASPYNGMLRFDYTRMFAGTIGAAGTGCFACHTSKGR